MYCKECGGEMVPKKDVVCPSGTDLCSAPSWYCPDCFNILYVVSDKEFDYWIARYIEREEDDSVDKFSLYPEEFNHSNW